MTGLSFLADEHVKRSFVTALREHGFDVQATAEDSPGQDDSTLLEYARSHELVIITNDDDFVKIAQEHTHSGIIYYNNQGHRPGEFLVGIRRIDRYLSSEEFDNHVEWLENWL